MRDSELVHELSNPAQIVSGMLRRLRVIANADVIEKDKLNLAIDSLEKASRRISELLRRHRGVDASRRVVRVAEILDAAAEAIRLAHPGKGEISVQLDDPQSRVQCDPMRMVQVIVNLLNNALEASPTKPTRIVLSVRNDADTTRICIEDDGPGIAPAIRSQIFSAGFSTKGGTGLGLAISRDICAQEEGSLELDSSTAQARFVIQLPSIQENS